jgi:hypothetical protein
MQNTQHENCESFTSTSPHFIGGRYPEDAGYIGRAAGVTIHVSRYKLSRSIIIII